MVRAMFPGPVVDTGFGENSLGLRKFPETTTRIPAIWNDEALTRI